MALFLLSQVFLILSHSPLVTSVADFLLNGDMAVTANLEAASADGTPEVIVYVMNVDRSRLSLCPSLPSRLIVTPVP